MIKIKIKKEPSLNINLTQSYSNLKDNFSFSEIPSTNLKTPQKNYTPKTIKSLWKKKTV